MEPSDKAYDFYEDMQIPVEPHVEIAFDPPVGLHFSNPKDFCEFENENTSVSYLFFHPPAPGGNAEGPCGMNYCEYFRDKSRLWELRIQVRFKKVPTPDMDMFFGLELDSYGPLTMAAKQAQNLCLAAIKHAGFGVYHSPGDDPSTTKGEVEMPVCVLPMWGFDQFIVTPEGEKPPNLADPNFPNLGSRRHKRMAAYAKEIEALQKNLKEGETYTFGFWGISRFLDILNWTVIGIPVATPADFNKFAGRPPIRVVIYGMEPRSGSEADDSKEKRHLQSRKSYYFRAMLWSSCRRPERSRFEALTGMVDHGVSSSLPSPRTDRTPRRMIRNFLKEHISDPSDHFLKQFIADPWKHQVAEPTEHFVKKAITEPWKRSVAEPVERFFKQSIADPWKHSVAQPTENFLKHKVAEPTEQFFKHKVAEPTEHFFKHSIAEPWKHSIAEPDRKSVV